MQAQVPPLTSEGSAISSSFLYLGFVVKRDQSNPAMIKTGSTAKNTSLSVLSHQRMGRSNPIQNIQETCGSKHLQNNANINTWPINMTHGLQTYDIPQFHPHIGLLPLRRFQAPKRTDPGDALALAAPVEGQLYLGAMADADPHDVYTGTRDSPQDLKHV